MFYVEKDNEIKIYDTNRERLEFSIRWKPELSGLDILETEENYTIVDYQIVTLEEAQEIERQKEEARKAQYKLTKADFWIACLDLGITKAMVKEKIALIPDETVRAKTEIRLDDAEFFYRGDTGLITLAKMFGITDIQLNAIFKIEE